MDNKKNFNFLGIFFAFGILILSIYFVLAAAAVPDNLIINQNVTLNYDEGNFTVNWTAGDGGDETNYSIYIYAGSTLFAKVDNDSVTGYSFNNWAEANYSFTIEAVNSTGNNENSTTNVSMYVDRTAPVIALPVYTNGTFKQNSSSLTLNISVSDAISGLDGFCFVNVNGTNQSITINSGWCNITDGYLTNLADGNQTISVYVNDTINNLGLNNSYVVQIDTTAPTASPSCSESSVVVGSTFTCTCGGSDASSGINSSLTGAGVTLTPLTEGTFSYSCSVTDNVGNSASATTSYIVLSSGGGSSTTNEWSEQKIHSFTKITPGKVSIMKNFNKETGIKEIQIEVNNEAQNVKITVSKYNGKPTEVSVEKTGKVYKYLQIKTTNLETNLKKAIVTIQVEKSWVSDNSLNKDNIALFKFDNNSNVWNELATTYKEDDNDSYYYDAELTSFSYFAISEKVVVEEEVVKEDKSIGTILGDIGEGAKDLTWLWIVIVVLVVIAAYVIFNRKKEE